MGLVLNSDRNIQDDLKRTKTQSENLNCMEDK